MVQDHENHFETNRLKLLYIFGHPTFHNAIDANYASLCLVLSSGSCFPFRSTYQVLASWIRALPCLGLLQFFCRGRPKVLTIRWHWNKDQVSRWRDAALEANSIRSHRWHASIKPFWWLYSGKVWKPMPTIKLIWNPLSKSYQGFDLTWEEVDEEARERAKEQVGPSSYNPTLLGNLGRGLMRFEAKLRRLEEDRKHNKGRFGCLATQVRGLLNHGHFFLIKKKRFI